MSSYQGPTAEGSDHVYMSEVIARRDELTELCQQLGGPGEMDDNDLAEMEALSRLIDDVESAASDPLNGTLINESYFEQYAKDQLQDLYGVSASDWPMCFIDWPAAAASLRGDFSAVEYGRTTYLIR